MGGERASTTRQREAGKICYECRRFIDSVPWQQGERLCDICSAKRIRHRIAMDYVLEGDMWRVTFRESNFTTQLPRVFHYSSSHKITEIADRGGGTKLLEHLQALEFGISRGRGVIWLDLTDEQYRTLR